MSGQGAIAGISVLATQGEEVSFSGCILQETAISSLLAAAVMPFSGRPCACMAEIPCRLTFPSCGADSVLEIHVSGQGLLNPVGLSGCMPILPRFLGARHGWTAGGADRETIVGRHRFSGELISLKPE